LTEASGQLFGELAKPYRRGEDTWPRGREVRNRAGEVSTKRAKDENEPRVRATEWEKTTEELSLHRRRGRKGPLTPTT